MAAQHQYSTAGAFRTALEARLNERARRDGVDLHRLRRQVAFDRLLARMFDLSQPVRDDWVLKGGYALEMRFHMARSTKDLDLTVKSIQGGVGDSISLRERLQLAASIHPPDFFTFIVGEAIGIAPVVVPALSIEQHWAEKFHAYSRPREATNSRVRDLVDLVLILEEQQPSIERVRQAVAVT